MPSEFQAWLRKNSQTLRKFGADEIAYLALMNGFPRELVYGNVSDHMTYLKRLLTFWESPLLGNWLSLSNYERGIE